MYSVCRRVYIAGNCSGVEREPCCGVIRVQIKEGVLKVVRVEQFLVIVNDVRHVEEYLIEAELLDLAGPRKSFEVPVQSLRGIPKPS
jgi:hypothetical protein